jgi:hypothetical protein
MCKQIHTKAKRILMINRYMETLILDKNYEFMFYFNNIFFIAFFTLPVAAILKLITVLKSLFIKLSDNCEKN